MFVIVFVITSKVSPVEDYMKNRLCSLLALPLFLPALALANTISTFDVEGAASNISGGALDSCAANTNCDFSGTLQVDVTAGAVETSGLDFAFPGLPDFETLTGVLPGNPWEIFAENSSSDHMSLVFTTTPTPGSLVDFTGGTISAIIVNGPTTMDLLYAAFLDSGSITPAVTPVPEPSSLVPLTGGIGWLVFGFVRRRRTRTR
jgi:hypothetical protein